MTSPRETAASDPGVAEDLLNRYFGYSAFLPGQEAVIRVLLQGGSAVAIFPTGGGKSLCYQLPALAFEGVTLVVSPLIALMKDQIDFLQARGIAAARLDSTLSLQETLAINDQLREGSLKLLYVAPERFNNERFLSQLQRTSISLLAIDEAHCISEWGHNFRPDYLKLAEIARTLQVPRVLALTATATPSVVEDIRAAFEIPPGNAVVTGFYRPNLELHTTPVPAADRDTLLLERLRSRPPGPTIVYVTLQRTAEEVAARLSAEGLPARAYHAGMDHVDRAQVQDAWMASDRGIVVATIAFGMGIDKTNVRYVYHYNLPKSLESYSQEIGRAGRDGAPSVVELFATPEDVPTLESFAFGDTPAESSIGDLVSELLNGGPELAISQYELANRHDIRTLVLRTLLTYLELQGVFRQGTPFYAGYEVRPLIPIDEIIGQFQGEPAQLVQSLFQFAKKGRTWYSLNPDEAAGALQQERRRVVRALEYLQEHGWVELRTADLRHRYYRVDPEGGADALAPLTEDLNRRFQTRENREIERVRMVLDLVTHTGCQTRYLASYFGEERAEDCGHCTYCRTDRPSQLPPLPPPPAPPGNLDVSQFESLRRTHPEALGHPRQAARFLCGLTSPALTRAKLTRHPLFGALEGYRFPDVLAWCETL